MSATPLVDAHCHLWIDPAPGVSEPRLTDEALALAELRAFRASGGVAVIDCQPNLCGRDGRVLRRLAEGSDVEILPATGFHMRKHYGRGHSPYEDPDTHRERWLRDLADGLEEEPALRARVVKSAWAGGREVTEFELMNAAAEAAAEAGVPLIVHTERGAEVEQLVELLATTPQDPVRTQLSHVDKRPDPGLHRELLAAGFVLGYDTFLRPQYEPERNVWPLLLELAHDGNWRRITVGLDLVQLSAWSSGGGRGLPAIAGAILPRLRAELDETAAAALVGGNALALLRGVSV